jgi:hypothetical protein
VKDWQRVRPRTRERLGCSGSCRSGPVEDWQRVRPRTRE